jgi:hypothetical protein
MYKLPIDCVILLACRVLLVVAFFCVDFVRNMIVITSLSMYSVTADMSHIIVHVKFSLYSSTENNAICM